MSDTPRTDSKLDEMSHCPRIMGDAMIVSFARELERELSEAQNRIKGLESVMRIQKQIIDANAKAIEKIRQ